MIKLILHIDFWIEVWTDPLQKSINRGEPRQPLKEVVMVTRVSRSRRSCAA